MKKAGVLLVAAVALLSARAASAQCCYTEMDLSGAWRSAKAEDRKDGSYEFREFLFTPKTWTGSITRFADRDRKRPLFTFTAVGTYTVNESSHKVKGANHAAFRFLKKELTLLTSDVNVIKRLGFVPCGLIPGLAKDISVTGCSFFRSVDEYPVEYDLVRRDGNTLSFGARPADGDLGSDDRRPVALGHPLVKAENR